MEDERKEVMDATLRTKASEMNICFVLPTRNEEATVKEVIGELRTVAADAGFKSSTIIVTDDSKDRTRLIAAEECAVVVNGGGKGLGYAMFGGLKRSLSHGPDVIVSMDADGQSDPSEIYRFLEPVLND